MDKKAWLVVILCALGMVYLYPSMMRDMTPRPAPEVGTGAEGESAASRGEEGREPGSGETESGMGTSETEEDKSLIEEQLVELETEGARFVLTNLGGGIARVVLNSHTRTREDTGLIELNEDAREPIGAMGTGIGNFNEIGYEIVSSGADEVVFEGETPDGLRVRKRYWLAEGADEYLVNLDVTIKNETGYDYRRSDMFIFAGEASPLHPAEWPQQTGFFWRDESKMRFKSVSWFAPTRFIIQFSSGHESLEEEVEELHWAGVMNQFYALVITNRNPSRGEVWAKRFPVELKGYEASKNEKPLYAVEGGMGLPDLNLKPGDQVSFEYDIYAGPKEFRRLRSLGDHRSEVMNYGGMPVVGFISAPVSQLLVRLLTKIHGFGVGYGWAIVIMTLLIRIVIWPLHAKSTRTMKRMALLGPKMQEMKEKYPDDPQKMNQEMMRMYKEYGVNPFGGCLPVFIQLPIFLGFYRMLQSAVELRHESFFWVKDLSMPDTLGTIFGFPFNLMPILMGITMLLQMKVTPKTGDKMQQRLFMFMPLIFLFFCYNFASALALYWTTQNIFSIGQTWYMGRMDPPVLEKKKAKPSLLEKAQARTKVSGQGPSQTKSRKKRRKK
ncbi:MAG: membrane protein insertase YidC [Verrucomicrobiota bacterium]